MEPISSWSPETVSTYLQGLEPSVQHYPFQEWDISGQALLDLSPQQLEAFGVKSIGHQEIILEAVEQLCALHYDLHRESLFSLTDKLHRVAQMLRSHIITLKKAPASQTSGLSPTLRQLASIIDIVSAARGLFSWLNRYLFTRLNDYSACRDVISLCVELAEMLHKDWSDPQVEARILTVCENICGICKSVLNYSPESLLSQTATLESVQLYPDPSHSLGLEIKSTSSGQHFVCRTVDESPASLCEGILPGDEIVKVNDQVVVGWTHTNLVHKLQEKLNFVTLVLKKVSVPLSKLPSSQNKKKSLDKSTSLTDSAPPSPSASNVPVSPTEPGFSFLLKANSVLNQSKKQKPLLTAQSVPTPLIENKVFSAKLSGRYSESLETASSTKENLSEAKEDPPSGLSPQGHNTWNCPGTAYYKPHASVIFPSVSVPSSEPETSPEMFSTIFAKTLTPIAIELDPQGLRFTSRPRSGSDSTSPPVNSLSLPSSVLRPAISDSNLLNKTDPVDSGQKKGLKDPQEKPVSTISPGAEKKLPGLENDKSSYYHKGVFGTVPRKKQATKLSRRRVSCRELGSPDCDGWLWKRKENVGFMSQRWKNCWCVLKKDKLYWYNGPQDEKAVGLLNISAYTLESPRETKHRKKYEFQLTHQTYKPFVFAADNLTEMNKWVTCLVKILQKYKAQSVPTPAKEEDCYSETEAEDDDQYKAQDTAKKLVVLSPTKTTTATSPVSTKEKGAEGIRIPSSSTVPAEGRDDLEAMMSCLKQGGVSLIGKKTAMTRDEYRKSFARRNKNPEINHKAHTLRVLQSTLKAKLQELEALNQILDHANLDSATFQKWKSEHEQLYGGIEKVIQEAAEHTQGAGGENDTPRQDSDESDASD
ncbi:connector enhancer of kinase suppressor of ras 1 isoform X3 [Hyperolius riggenbachi]|uniref:connector enhancer of kinase suppressor of ras 1 isoform X3 n=1 Tax=Hyperolius riggenbachi TaxID=752182 RepID=UPI0035A37478